MRSGSSAGATFSVSAARRSCRSSSWMRSMATVARHRLDAAQVRADRPLADDLDRADEPERVDVRPAAQLDRVVPGFEHAHDVAVLLAEERDRADALGVRLGRLVVADGRVGDDLAVRERFDLDPAPPASPPRSG